MIVYLLVIFAVLYGIYQVLVSVLPRLFLVPPQNWRTKIQKVIDYSKPIYLSVGNKRSAFRRRLILASAKPSFYTNFVNNKIKIEPTKDWKNEDNEFMDAMKRRAHDDPQRNLIYGFFHPYANNGGGGERVLWQAVQATLMAADNNIVAIYTTNVEAAPLEILAKVRAKFAIEFGSDEKRIVFIYLRKYGTFIDASYWQHFTILGQFLGLGALALEAMYELSPDIFVDTIGLPGSYFFVSLVLKCPILSYVHYPVLQLEMFQKLKFPDFGLQSLKWFQWSFRDLKEFGKLCYWLILYYLYVYLGSLVDVTLTNGTWTQNHITSIWSLNIRMEKCVEICYPPCGDLDATSRKSRLLSESPKSIARKLAGVGAGGGSSEDDFLARGGRSNIMLYIAQFRPEKRHSLLLDEYAKFLKENKRVSSRKIPSLVFLGSCRTPEDTSTLKTLQKEAKALELDVKFVVDCSYEEVLEWLSKAKYGLNAMWNEHFGIGVVEYLNNGVIPIVHASAGPYLDIVTGYKDEEDHPAWRNNTGFFFKDELDPDFSGKRSKANGFLVFDEKNRFPSFSQLLTEILVNEPSLVGDRELDQMRSNGAHLVEKFSNKAFVEKWMKHLVEVQYLEKIYRERRDGIESVY